MSSVFFSGTGQFLIDVLPEGMKMDTDYFAANTIEEIAKLCDPRGTRQRQRRVMLYFDNASTDCTDTVRGRTAAAQLERTEQRPPSPEMAPCGFFLFGSVKGKLLRKQDESPEDLVSEVTNIIESIPPDRLKVSSNPGKKDC
jgi:hypothetical protein